MTPFRVGIGNDIHRLMEGRPLFLGGVEIEHSKGADAHSDGDVVLHATVDALLGAAGLGDIGELFPDDDPAYKNMASKIFIAKTLKLLAEHGCSLVNIDAIIMAQAPRLKAYKPAIRERMAELLKIPIEQVNVKAKTGERIGPIGEERAIAAEVVVLIEKV
ncbi:MAG: 2-C-methyl-D-erythritol 2,4-cyclodiphosphate synthase [Planctomycetota bacterium]|nr:2-C-methyl-D-erythritol 2,4-cyclodiphosphate synthase [Planctomycetota bacterium]MDA1138192.1 2-C-methyl-D-erythritol 2,4-cyclodiphosphate synthase [Planctomycetota bacterium]